MNVSTWRIRCHVILFSTTFSMYFPICSLPIFLMYEDQSAWPTSPDPCLIFQTHYLLRPIYNHSFHCSYISKWKNPSWPASDLDMQLLLAAVSITEPFAFIINSHTHTLVKPIDMATNPPYGQVRCPEWFTKGDSVHQQGQQLHDSTAPMMQTRYLFVGKSVGFHLEKSYSLAIHAYGAY